MSVFCYYYYLFFIFFCSIKIVKMFEFVYELFGLKFSLFVGFLGSVYLYATWTHGYWSKLGIPCALEPVPLFGNAMPSILGRMHFMDILHDLYRKLGDRPYGGIYTMRTPQLLVKDPELIGTVLLLLSFLLSNNIHSII